MRTLAILSVATLGLLASAAVPVVGADPALMLIQPGAGFGMGTPAICTQGFVFRDASGTWYGSTAAHCVTLNQRILGPTGVGLATVVVDDDDENPGGIDFALFRVDAEDVDEINPAVRRWGGPTAPGGVGDIAAGDPVLHFGNPEGFGYHYPGEVSQMTLAQGRVGFFESYFDGRLHFTSAAVPGDSGGPVISAETGLALGQIQGFGGFHFTSPVTSINVGPSMDQILARMQAFGFTLTLQTAPFTPFP